MLPYFTQNFGNPSSVYKLGQENKKAVELAKERIAKAIGADVDEIYFTCRENLNDNSEVLFQCSLGDGISIVEYDDEHDIMKYAIRIAPNKTENLQSGTYYYDLELGVNSDIFTIMKGRFIIEQDSSRGDD